jgi:4-diphosphocytidyl-2-C-methyl-D-erythritol kinase
VSVVEVEVRAKLNLTLRVGRRRADGYHDLEALTVAITEPHDVLTVSRLAPGSGVHLTVGGPVADVPTGAENLAARAALQLGTRTDLPLDVELALHKRIPMAAGLGGGSMDAAAALLAVRRLLDLPLPDSSLAAIAAGVGSDVAFGLGEGAAWVRGRGDLVEPTVVPPLRMLVAVPAVRCPTPAVYAAWDELGGPAGRVVAAPAGCEALPPLVNDLEPAAVAVEPALAEFRAAVERATGRDALLAGSGSAYVALYADDETPGRDCVAVREATGATVFAAALADRPVALR